MAYPPDPVETRGDVTDEERERRSQLAAKLNLFPEVAWDRWGEWYLYPGEEEGEAIYSAAPFGWIARDDGRFDFFVLHVFWTAEHGIYHIGSDTSSARYSREFAERLGLADLHQDCRRIEDDFGDLVQQAVVLA